MIDITVQLKLLVELQGLDTQIFRSEEELEAIPQRIGAMDEQFKTKSANLKALEDGVKTLQLKRKEREGELQSKEESIKKFQSQMFQVKTNKEYSALQEEINRVKADNSVIEEDIIKIFDQVDAENRKIAQEKEFLKKEEAVFAEAKRVLNDEAARIQGAVEKLRIQRAELAAKVDKTVLTKYERILSSKDHLAVVSVAGDSCQGCFRILPPQVINEIRIKAGLVVCENCARILYIEE